jgi:hypothetical protein
MDTATKWQTGMRHYLESYTKTAEEIHTKAKEMPNESLEDAAAIVEMSNQKTIEHARKYRKQNEA